MTRQRLKWGDLGELFDGPHATPKRREEGAYFLNISSLKSGRLDLKESDRVSEEDFEKWTRRVTPQEGDLLFSYETRLGEAALMPVGLKACLGRRMALLRPDPRVIQPQYLLYFYLSPQFQRLIDERSIVGATVPRILLSTMPDWPIEVHPVNEQQAIVDVLACLDDKIESDFLTALSSVEIIRAVCGTTSGGGVQLAEVATLSKGSVNPESMGEVAHFSLPAFDGDGLPELTSSESILSNKQLLERPCVLLSKLNPRIPRIWDVTVLPDQPGLASTEFLVLVGKVIPTGVLWGLLIQPEVQRELEGLARGTTGSHQRVKPEDAMRLTVPDPAALGDVAIHLVDALSKRIWQAKLESRTLAALRDTLLPALMSGRLSVRDAETAVSEVV